MHSWYLVSMWFHILAAAFWIGGSLFLALVLIPGLRASSFRDRMAELLTAVAQRFSWAAWTGFGLLVATGVFNLIYRGVTVEGIASGEFWRSWYGEVLAWKLTLVILILSLSGVHDFFLGPWAARVWKEEPHSRLALRLRLVARWIGRTNLLLGLIVVALGIILTRGWP